MLGMYKGYKCLCGLPDAKWYRIIEFICIGVALFALCFAMFCYHGLFMLMT